MLLVVPEPIAYWLVINGDGLSNTLPQAVDTDNFKTSFHCFLTIYRKIFGISNKITLHTNVEHGRLSASPPKIAFKYEPD